MKKLNLFTILCVLMLLMISVTSEAQFDKIERAYTYLQQGNLDSAKINIDSTVINPETANSPDAWYIRSFLYKEIFNKKEKSDIHSPARKESLNSFQKLLVLDTGKQFTKEIIQSIKYLSGSFYSLAGDNLDTLHYKIAIEMFEKYKEYYPLADTSKANIRQKEIEFSNAIASVYTRIFESDKKAKMEFLTLAKNTYNKVLQLDPNNISANYNLGILFYNQAVDLIKQQDYDLDLVTLSDVQDNSILLFKESLPFMEKAYSLNPKKKETLVGLSGIYFSLNEKEKSDMFKQKLEEINKQK